MRTRTRCLVPPLVPVVLLLVGCGDGGSAPGLLTDPFCESVLPRVDAFVAEARASRPVPDDPRYGGTVTVGGIAEFEGGMNVLTARSAEGVQQQQFVNLMTLIAYDERFEPRPYLAESWEVADDTSSITFRLRDDVFWHDGERTVAEDVAFTYRLVTDPESDYANANYWDSYVRGDEGLEVVDSLTLRVRLRPHAEFLDPWRTLPILPAHLLGGLPPDSLDGHPFGTRCPVGNGPFVFRAHQDQEYWEFDANPAFPEELGGRPFVDRYVYRVIPEQSTLLAELLTGGIDVYIQLHPDQAQRVIDDPGTELIRFTGRAYTFVSWNARVPRLSDPRVRRAFTMALDRESLVDGILLGYGEVARASVPPFHWAYDSELPGLPYDPAAARALLAEAGWVNRDDDPWLENAAGEELEFTVKYNDGAGVRADVAQVMQAQLGELGVRVLPQAMEMTSLIAMVVDDEQRQAVEGRSPVEAVVLGWTVDFRLDDIDLFHSDRIDGRWAWTGTRNPEMDRLILALQRVTDRSQALALWREYQEALVEEQPYTFLFYQDRTTGVRNRMRAVEMDARGEWQNLRSWYLDPASR